MFSQLLLVEIVQILKLLITYEDNEVELKIINTHIYTQDTYIVYIILKYYI